MDVKFVIKSFKDVVAASTRNDPDVRARLRACFPDHRAPLPEEFKAFEAIAFENYGPMFKDDEEYHAWFANRYRQFLQMIKQFKDNEEISKD